MEEELLPDEVREQGSGHADPPAPGNSARPDMIDRAPARNEKVEFRHGRSVEEGRRHNADRTSSVASATGHGRAEGDLGRRACRRQPKSATTPEPKLLLDQLDHDQVVPRDRARLERTNI